MRWLGLLFLLACGGDVGGPIARIQRTTGCTVPPGAVRVHDHLGGDADTFVMHAKVVVGKSRIDAFVQSCGFSEPELQVGYDHHGMFPEEPLTWWNPPDRQLGRGALREADGQRNEILVVERDTDFAVYLKASGRVR